MREGEKAGEQERCGGGESWGDDMEGMMVMDDSGCGNTTMSDRWRLEDEVE